MMNTALARLRAKTDRDLAVLIRRELQRSMALAERGRYIEAARASARAKQWLTVANLSASEMSRLQRLLDVPAVACA
jgi:hypothetical protein